MLPENKGRLTTACSRPANRASCCCQFSFLQPFKPSLVTLRNPQAADERAVRLINRRLLVNDFGIFPFGEKVKPVEQVDRSPKKVFVLGVYASAVHARWLGTDGKVCVSALAVASEPEIFWRGDGAKSIVDGIPIPAPFGKLVPAAAQLNGPSGRSLDDEYLAPLGFDRSDVWLSDIYPYSRMNTGQRAAIEREYLPYLGEYDIPVPTLQPAPTSGPGEERREEIWDEYVQSQAEVLILLGDKPIEWFFSHLEPQYQKLSDFGKEAKTYGQLHLFRIRGRQIGVLPLVHPRQASRLGASSAEWAELHQTWKTDVAARVIVK